MKKFGSDMTKWVTLPIVGLGAAAVKAADKNGSFGESLKDLGRQASAALVPLGESLIGAFERMRPAIERVIGAIGLLAQKFSQLSPTTQNLIITLAAVAAATGPVILGLSAIVLVVKNLTTAMKAMMVVAAAAKRHPIVLALSAAAAVGGYLLIEDLLSEAEATEGRAVAAFESKDLDKQRTARLEATIERVHELRRSVRPMEELEHRLINLRNLAADFPGVLSPDVVSDLAGKYERELNPAFAALEAEGKKLHARIDAITQAALAPADRIKQEIDEVKALMGLRLLPKDIGAERIRQLLEELKKLSDEGKELFGDKLASTIKGFANDASSAFADMVVDGTASFDQLSKAWAKTLISMATQFLIFQPFFDSLANALGPAFGGAKRDGKDVNQEAHGDAFSHGEVIPFASGGVVRRPTLFPMARGGVGLMGEAGPEAILPLTRVGGDLGVKAAGGGVVVNVVDQRSGGEAVQVRESQGPNGERQIDIIVRDAMRRIIGGGGMDRLFGQAYGVRRRPR